MKGTRPGHLPPPSRPTGCRPNLCGAGLRDEAVHLQHLGDVLAARRGGVPQLPRQAADAEQARASRSSVRRRPAGSSGLPRARRGRCFATPRVSSRPHVRVRARRQSGRDRLPRASAPSAAWRSLGRRATATPTPAPSTSGRPTPPSAIGESPAPASYLNPAAIVEAALRSGAEAVHPGYGFLSESPKFAAAVLDAGLAWIGPSPDVLELTGDKAACREAFAADGVPGAARGPGRSSRSARRSRRPTRSGSRSW